MYEELFILGSGMLGFLAPFVAIALDSYFTQKMENER